MIVIEGPDRAGKTTLSELIAKNHKSDVRHLAGSRYEGNRLLRHWDLVEHEMAEYIRTRNKNVVYDRMVIGSLVYSFKKDIHNIQPVTVNEYGEWLKWMATTNTMLICALPPLEVLLERMKVGESYITTDDMVRIYNSYDRIFAKFEYPHAGYPFPIVFYDSHKESALSWYARHADLIKDVLK